MWTVVTPCQAAVLALRARYPRPAAGAMPTHALAGFQAEAAAAAAAALARWGGVVLADRVGLGKSYVALALVESALRRGERVAVVTPAALRRDWCRRLERVGRAAGVACAHGLKSDGGGADGLLAWLSHTRLSRGGHWPERLVPLDLLVVDEAHAFRNPATRRYRALAELARGARVALVTATPVNNSARDLHALLRLFAAEDAFVDIGVPDLRGAVEAAERGEAGRLRPVLAEVVIRRTCVDLRDRPEDAPGLPMLRFPARRPPRAVRYSLDESSPGLFEVVVGAVEALALAPYRLREYGDAAGGAGGEAELLRLMLLKRLESGLPALRASVARMLRYQKAFSDALEDGLLLSSREHRCLFGGGDGDAVQLVLGPVTLRPAPSMLRRGELAAAVTADVERLRRLDAALADAGRAGDPKLEALLRLLEGKLAVEKSLVFTEFRDSARALWQALSPRLRVGLIDGSGAALGRAPASRRQVVERFAPAANEARIHDRERVDVLIATDVLAEGMNLQDARVVVSYDLPWNPVRLIQRVGRVDRLGSPHRTVESWHFLPDRELEPMLRLVERLLRKLATIGVTVGAEAAVLAGGGSVGGYTDVAQRLAAGDPEVLDGIEADQLSPFAVRQRVLDTLARAEAALGRLPRPPVAAAFEPQREGVGPAANRRHVLTAVVVLELSRRVRCVVLEATNRDAAERAGPGTWRPIEDHESADSVLLAALDSPAAPLAPDVAASAVAAARLHVAAGVRLAETARSLHARQAAARAARRLGELLAAVPGGPQDEICRRADALLRPLARGQIAGTERAIEAALATHARTAPCDADDLMTRLEAALASGPGAGRGPALERDLGSAPLAAGPAEWSLVAVLVGRGVDPRQRSSAEGENLPNARPSRATV